MKKSVRLFALVLSCFMLFSFLPSEMISHVAAMDYYCFGDVDGDGVVTAGDARIVLRTALGLISLSGNSVRAADMTQDHVISAADARWIERASIMMESLPEMPDHDTATDDYSSVYNLPDASVTEGEAELDLEVLSINDGTVTLALVARDCIGLTSGDVELRFDPEIFYNPSVKKSSSAVMCEYFNCEEDVLRFSFYFKNALLEATAPEWNLSGNEAVNDRYFQIAKIYLKFNTESDAALELRIKETRGVSAKAAPPRNAMHMHSFSWETTAEVTCASVGRSVGICSVCGYRKSTVENTLPHSFDNGVVARTPSCTEKGELVYTCSVCGTTRTEQIGMLSHHDQDLNWLCDSCGTDLRPSGDVRLGDVDFNGAVWAEDARLMLRRVVGLESWKNKTADYAADVNGNHAFSAADARLILRRAVALESFSTVSVDTLTPGDHFSVYDLPDADGPEGNGVFLLKTSTVDDDYVSLTLLAVNCAGLSSGDVELCFDPNVFDFSSIYNSEDASEMLNTANNSFVYESNAHTDGKLKLSFYFKQSLEQDYLTPRYGKTVDIDENSFSIANIYLKLKNEIPETAAFELHVKEIRGAYLSKFNYSFNRTIHNHTPAAERMENEIPASCIAGGSYVSVICCRKCGAEISRTAVETAPLGHDFGAWTVTKAAACTEKGEEKRECSRCDAFETREIPALGHVEETIPAVPATCTEKGSTAGVKCSRCGTVLTAQTAVPATGHNYETVVTKATLTKDGKTVPTCTVCGATKTAAVIAKASKITSSKAKFVYNGKVQRPTLTVKNSAGKAIASKYYTVKWSNASSKAVGSYTVTVTFTGNYSGTKTLTYTIVPKAVTGVKNAASTTKSVKLTWTKATGAKYYEVYGSLDGKTFKKISTVSTNTLNVTKIGGKALATGKTYWFKVRALDGTKKLIGAYSAALKTGTLTAAPKLTKLTSAKSKTAAATWGKVTGAKSYTVYKSTDGKKWTKAGTTTSTTFALTGLTGGKRIYVKVLAVNAYKANSAYSAAKYVTVKK